MCSLLNPVFNTKYFSGFVADSGQMSGANTRQCHSTEIDEHFLGKCTKWIEKRNPSNGNYKMFPNLCSGSP